MISFVTGLSNLLRVIVKNQESIQNWMLQLGNFGNFFAYLFMGLPAGIILKRKGYKFTALSAIAVDIVGISVNYRDNIGDPTNYNTISSKTANAEK